MVLLCNTLITETKPPIGKGYVFRENLRSYSNFDIFKYSLASLAVAYPWKRVILYISLDTMYQDRQQELEDFINEEFKDFPLILRWNRNEYQNSWKRTYEDINDDLIWFYCNHDHIFIDSSQDYLKLLVEEMRKEELCSLQFSHWPESIRTAKKFSNYKIHDNYISIENAGFDSIQIITKELYRRWWFEGEFNNIKLPRPDYFGIGLAEIKPVPTHKVILPLKELCRHFDGYQHVYPPITNEQCPALEIPEGFFENNVKIKYIDNNIKTKGWTNFNPMSETYKAVDENGVDYKWTIEDLPLVWKKRVKQIYQGQNIEEELMVQFKLKAVLEMVHTDPSFQIDLEVEEKILKLQLLKHPKFTI